MDAAMEGQEGTLQQQQQPQQQHPQLQPYYSYNQSDYQYPIGHHWMTPGLNSQNHTIPPDHNYNSNNNNNIMMAHLSNSNTNSSNNQNQNHTIHHTHHHSQLSQHQSQYLPVTPTLPPFQPAPPSYLTSSNHNHQNQNHHHHHHQQHQHQGNQNQNLSQSSQQHISNQMVGSSIIPPPRTPWSSTLESVYPGGLEVLWREVPDECQKIMSFQDVPDSAKFRGYFTVCELIALKRSLVARLGCSNNKEVPEVQTASTTTNTTNEGAEVTTVKDPINPSEEDQQKQSQTNEEMKPECSVDEGGNDAVKTSPSTSGSGGNLDDPTSSTTTTTTTLTTCSTGPISSTTTVGVTTNLSSPSTTIGPPPPYRTATLVFKLLQIGNYQFRSFSEINPNRLRVLFNTQRLAYECQLPLVRPPREGMQPLRKLLTVDIGFDQITVIRFGIDKLCLRVEGAPLLTVTYNPSNDDHTCPPLSQQDHILLDQIDKGQLKLSPCHQLYFLNERLVHLLEAQFREHPRFRHILQQNHHLY